MFPKLLLLFVGLPLIELMILIEIGQAFGLWPTIALVVFTGVLGASLARFQGFVTLTKIQQELNAGRVPTNDLADGLLILIGGIVLLTPGVLTDLFGFSLLTPFIRTQIKGWLYAKFEHLARNQSSNIFIRHDLPPDDRFQ